MNEPEKILEKIVRSWANENKTMLEDLNEIVIKCTSFQIKWGIGLEINPAFPEAPKGRSLYEKPN